MRSVPYQAIKLRVRPFDFYEGGRKMFSGPVFIRDTILYFICIYCKTSIEFTLSWIFFLDKMGHGIYFLENLPGRPI